jgi:hypothetical protein
MEQKTKLSPNILALIALTNEYCHTLETVMDSTRDELVVSLLKLLPRIYISVTDIDIDTNNSENYIDSFLKEETYDQLKNEISEIMAEDDVYLEVFVEDMRYSDTPIATSVSENLADLYQEFFNFIASVQNVSTELQIEISAQIKENFKSYWGQTLCNVMRALNTIYYNTSSQEF